MDAIQFKKIVEEIHRVTPIRHHVFEYENSPLMFSVLWGNPNGNTRNKIAFITCQLPGLRGEQPEEAVISELRKAYLELCFNLDIALPEYFSLDTYDLFSKNRMLLVFGTDDAYHHLSKNGKVLMHEAETKRALPSKDSYKAALRGFMQTKEKHVNPLWIETLKRWDKEWQLEERAKAKVSVPTISDAQRQEQAKKNSAAFL